LRGRRLAPALLIAITIAPHPARAQDTWAVGVTGAAGVPPFKAGVRVSTPLGRKTDLDVEVARVAPKDQPELGPAVTGDIRWMRNGRRPSGDSRYWIFGVMFVNAKWSTPVVYPGHVTFLEERRTLVVPRIGYGWDHVSRLGPRAGFEISTGSGGEQELFFFANVFVMWGPPRK